MRGGAWFASVLVVVAALARDARAELDNPFPDSTVISPGVKLGYVFGDGGGWSFGVEVTVLRRTGADLSAIVAHGPAVNIGWSRGGVFYARVGWEAVSWFAGVEGGPTLVRTRDGMRVGLTVSPWIGAIVVPYYAHTWLLGDRSIREVGTYLKLPLCTGCEGGNGGDWDWDDDD
jgi:hypothetical protein